MEELRKDDSEEKIGEGEIRTYVATTSEVRIQTTGMVRLSP